MKYRYKGYSLWGAFLGMGSAIFSTFLVVVDELFTLNLYCRTDWSRGWDASTFCVYPYPWGFGSGSGYVPWEFAFAMICVGVALMLIGWGELRREDK